MDGADMMRAIQAEFPDARVVALSGYSDFDTVHGALVGGAVDYLLKPVQEAQLYAVLEKLTRSETPETPAEGDVLRQVRDYIDANYAEELSLGMLSERFGLSQSWLSRSFKRAFDVNLTAYVTARRMKAALRLLETSSFEGVGSSALELSGEAGFRRCVETALAGGRCEELLDREDDCCRIYANPVEEDGACTGAILILMDVTEKERRDTLRREFAANVSHELKTPLTSILGTAEIIKTGLVKPEDIPHFAGNIFLFLSKIYNPASAYSEKVRTLQYFKIPPHNVLTLR
jgi:AraC-like DNA-binding protein